MPLGFGALANRPLSALMPLGGSLGVTGTPKQRFWELSEESPAWGFKMAAQLQLLMFRGEDRLWTFVPVPGAQGLNISGWTIVCNIWSQTAPPAIVLTKSTANGGLVITNGQPGYFTLSIAEVDTDGVPPLPVGVYPADIWRTDSGSLRCLAKGSLTIEPTPSH
jgi:hypothetical protein